MMTAVKGTYQNGKVELGELPGGISNGAEVVVTFLTTNDAEPEKPLVSLRGTWAGEFPEGFDLEAYLDEVGTEWKKDWEAEGIA